ncbi:hypothetical protein [Candidatus Nanoperiomorbus periodonticus]|uniref:hypothetical protein n=1 Tax=Candidatus Nanoperiomorbus periodonticus TaxID=2171989 RepID=UPI00101BF986|nr:hypothetical protein [Candidatus Nanoperiomorbus periodonticus]
MKVEEDEGKANSSKTIDRSGNTAFDSEAKQKASFRQELKGKPRLWVIVVIVVVIIVSMCPTTYVARPSVGIVEESPIINLSTKGVKPVTQADLDKTVARYKALSLVTACRDEYAHLKDTTEKNYRIYRSDSTSDENEPEFSEVMQADPTEEKTTKGYEFYGSKAMASTGLFSAYSNYQISCSILLNRSVADVLREIDSSIAVPSGSDRLIRQIVRQWIDEAGKPYLKPADVARVLTDEVINRVKLKPFDQQTAPVQFVGYVNWLKEVRECIAENSGLGTCVEDGVGVGGYYKFDHGSTLCTNPQGKYDIRAVYLEKGDATMIDSMRNGAIFYLPAHVENSTDSAQYSVTCDKAYRKLNETFKDYVLGINAGVDKLGEKLGEPYCHELRGPTIYYGIPPEKKDCRQR